MQAFIPDTIWDIGGLAATIYSIGQARQHHHEQLEQTKKHHEVEMDLAIKQHKKNLVETKRVYLLELFTNLEQHFQQLNADLISSGKEAERDMFDQRNQNFQTIILASSVMFTALSTVIIDGALPERTTEGLIVAFSLTSAFSFAFLFLSMVICMELVMRASSFMYRRARNHTEQLRQAIKDTKAMMEELRNGTRNHPVSSSTPNVGQPHVSSREEEADQLSPTVNVSGKVGGLLQRNNSSSTKLDPPLSIPVNGNQIPVQGQQHTHHRARKHRIISELDEEGLEREWNNHEQELQRFLAERERINDATALIGVDEKLLSEQPHLRERLTVSNRKSFQEFWNDSCKFWAELSILFFYGGTINLLLAIMVFMWAQFLHQYHSLVGAIIAISLITFTLVLGLCSVIGLRWMKVMELQYHPEEANRRRVGNQRMYSFSSFNNGGYANGQTNSNHQNPRSRGQLSAQTSVSSSRPTVSRSASISYLPEFGEGESDPDVEDIVVNHHDDSCRSEKLNKPLRTSSKKNDDTDDTNDDEDGELHFVSARAPPTSTPSQHVSRRGIAMPSPSDSDLTYTPSPSTPPPRTSARHLPTTQHTASSDTNSSLFRRPSPRSLFTPNSTCHNSNNINFNNNGRTPATPSRSVYGVSLTSPSPSRGTSRSAAPPPSTPSSTASNSTSADSYPPLPFRHTSAVSRGTSGGTPSSSDRRIPLNRQSSAPSTLSSPSAASSRPPQTSVAKHLL